MLGAVLRLAGAAALAVAATAQRADPSTTERAWWAYRPLARPDVPAVEQRGWCRSPIDAFVLARLEANGLRPAAELDRHALLRRVTYDLTGLPPTRAEIDAFVADDADDAYERVVDRLLASPQYGVKWAQHWLDLVRYAETDGYERDSVKPFVWRYRDWVVDSLNRDMPYGVFIQRQLAGDELPDASVADHVATGFYRLGIWDDEPTDREQHFYDVLDGIADTTARATMAISMGCARCHDHKKDPLPTAEYYAFLSYFENVASYQKKAETIPSDGARASYEQQLEAWRGQTAELRERLQQSLAAAAAGAEERRSSIACFDGDVASATELLEALDRHRGRIEGQIVQVPGKHGQALRFDGDDHAVLPRFVEDSFSVTFWVRSDQRGRGRADDRRWFLGTGLVDGEVPGIVDDWGIAWLGPGIVAAGVGRPETFVHSAPGLHDGQWHHVGFTREQASGRVALYVDGRLADEAIGSKRSLTSPRELFVGRSAPGGPGFVGDLDVIEFYDEALTAAEVVALALGGRRSDAAAISATGCLDDWSELQRPELETVEVLAVRERGPEPRPGYVRVRGNVHSRGAAVSPGLPSMLTAPAPRKPVPTERSSGRRSALADWIVSPDNALTWRVIANRIWQHHFGRGLVRSSNDFGRLGSRPTHPELLDWLAAEVLSRGQSLKAMHRLIVTSQTYRMSSAADAEALARDPQNDLLWRFDRRRLTAEEVRDSILAVDGSLNLELGGPSVFPPLPEAVLQTASRPDSAWGKSSPRQAARRSLYVHVKRSLPEPLLAAFDRADTDASCPVRFATVQPTQALTMLNGDFLNERAERFADRLHALNGDLEQRLRTGLAWVTQRPARDADVRRLLALAADLQRDYGRSERQALQRCCLVLLNCNEFLFLD